MIVHLHIDDAEFKVIEGRYLKRPILSTCDELFISKSEYYRILTRIFDKLCSACILSFSLEAEKNE